MVADDFPRFPTLSKMGTRVSFEHGQKKNNRRFWNLFVRRLDYCGQGDLNSRKMIELAHLDSVNVYSLHPELLLDWKKLNSPTEGRPTKISNTNYGAFAACSISAATAWGCDT